MDSLLEKFNYDLDAIYLDLKELEAKSGRAFVLLPPKRVTPSEKKDSAREAENGLTVKGDSTHRPYRPAMGIDAALEEIEKNAGVLYDRDVVETCLKLVREKGFRFE